MVRSVLWARGQTADGSDLMRIDAWLWVTRQFKSRSLATSAVRAGHVRVNDAPVKASYKVVPGDIVRIRVQGFDRVLEVVSMPVRRVSAPLARQAYIDHSPPRPKFYGGVPVRDPGAGRPTKKERRQLEELRGEEWAKHSRR